MKPNDKFNLKEILENDSKSPHPKYPSQALYALENDSVVNAVSIRIRNKQALMSIEALPYSFRTGLNFIYFQFEPNILKSIGSDAFLVILNHKCEVVVIIDPFDVVQPSPLLPSLPESEDSESTSDLPFCFSRPSFAESVFVTEEELYPAEVRSRAFFKRMGLSDLGDGGVFSTDDTNSSYETITRTAHSERLPPYRVFYIEDTKVDQVVDDHIA